jgi:hypothetical protein
MLDFQGVIQVIIISGLLITATCLVFYELMYFSWKNVDRVKINHRYKIFLIIIAIFTAHTFAVWLYGAVYYLLAELKLGYLVKVDTDQKVWDFMEYVYYSAVTYSSLGFGDLVPKAEIRFLTGVEVLNGLVLIGWSASYTYLSMEKFWAHRKGDR